MRRHDITVARLVYPVGPMGNELSVQIAPWLSVRDASQAVAHYQAAFGAEVVDRVADDTGAIMVAQLSLGGATFWVQADEKTSPPALGGRLSARMVLIVDDPDALFAQAIAAGANEIAAIHVSHGWRVGRLADPSGHHWEIGKRV
jgi:PhnB protein